MSTPDAQILFSKHFSRKRNQSCLEKWLNPGPEKRKTEDELRANILWNHQARKC